MEESIETKESQSYPGLLSKVCACYGRACPVGPTARPAQPTRAIDQHAHTHAAPTRAACEPGMHAWLPAPKGPPYWPAIRLPVVCVQAGERSRAERAPRRGLQHRRGAVRWRSAALLGVAVVPARVSTNSRRVTNCKTTEGCRDKKERRHGSLSMRCAALPRAYRPGWSFPIGVRVTPAAPL